MKTNYLDRLSPYLLLVLTTLFWAGNFNLARGISGDVPPMGLSFWRWVIAFIIFIPFAYRPMKKSWELMKQHFGLVFFLSLLGVTLFNSLVYIGLQSTTAINGVLMQSVCPIIIILLSTLIFGDRSTLMQWVGVLISLTGVGAILVKADITALAGLHFNQGDLWILLAVSCWALYTALLRKLPAALKGVPILGYTMVIGIMLIAPFYVFESLTFKTMPVTLTSVSSIAYVSIFASLLAFLFWNNAASRLGANRTGQFIHLIPAFGLTISTLVLGEQLQNYHYIGMTLVASGLILANLKTKQKVLKTA
ncbi:DMT family transporter [Leucothrix arctica]|uniref:EamA/RhaT family transporter n=1 Tax=Leucothrix arctica TaxID=1481894 RepID=A0A317CCY8_9GAMM|nr:DMT family transporter [Leucothrix arctica]PWQ96247.1 EamA/RhaT family transporter [Leucothrix arctica]